MKPKLHALGTPLLSGMDPIVIQKIMDSMSLHEFKPKSVLLKAGQKEAPVFWVTEGNLAIQWISPVGAEFTAFIHPSPSLVGHLEAFRDEPVLATVVAMDAVRAYTIDRKRFLILLQTHHQCAINVAQFTGRSFAESIRVQQQFAFGRAEEVIARCVLFLCKVYGREEKDGLVLDSHSTKTQIASLSGLSRRAVITAMRRLETLNLIRASGKKLTILDEKGLKNLSGKW